MMASESRFVNRQGVQGQYGCSRQLVVIVFGLNGHPFTQPGPTALEQA